MQFLGFLTVSGFDLFGIGCSWDAEDFVVVYIVGITSGHEERGGRTSAGRRWLWEWEWGERRRKGAANSMVAIVIAMDVGRRCSRWTKG